MTYDIRQNASYNSREVYFDGKPCEAVRDALKGLKMRWNRAKACWYGFATERELIDALQAAEPSDDPGTGATVYTDGYLGGGAVYGPKSGEHLYGAALSAAIRADLKKAGIRGVTVSSKTYSGGQSIKVTATLQPDEYTPINEYIIGYEIKSGMRWIYTGSKGDSISIDEYYNLPADEQNRIREKAAIVDFNRYQCCEEINHYYIDNIKAITPAAREKLHLINRIISAYRYDKSNSMVDYFDTNFYYDIYIKPAVSAPAEAPED